MGIGTQKTLPLIAIVKSLKEREKKKEKKKQKKQNTARARRQKGKRFSTRNSQMVTHSSTARSYSGLCMADRTGCPVFHRLWPNPKVMCGERVYISICLGNVFTAGWVTMDWTWPISICSSLTPPLSHTPKQIFFLILFLSTHTHTHTHSLTTNRLTTTNPLKSSI